MMTIGKITAQVLFADMTGTGTTSKDANVINIYYNGSSNTGFTALITIHYPNNEPRGYRTWETI